MTVTAKEKPEEIAFTPRTEEWLKSQLGSQAGLAEFKEYVAKREKGYKTPFTENDNFKILGNLLKKNNSGKYYMDEPAIRSYKNELKKPENIELAAIVPKKKIPVTDEMTGKTAGYLSLGEIKNVTPEPVTKVYTTITIKTPLINYTVTLKGKYSNKEAIERLSQPGAINSSAIKEITYVTSGMEKGTVKTTDIPKTLEFVAKQIGMYGKENIKVSA